MHNLQQSPDADSTPQSLSAHAQSAEQVIRHFATDVSTGLTASHAAQWLAQHGPNELAEAPPQPWWRRLAAQFKDLVIWILIAAAVIAGIVGDLLDTLVILAIVVLNGILGFIQEERAQQAMTSLRKLSAPQAKVIRDGQLQVIPARDLTPGDRIELEAGDHIPADARLIAAAGFRTLEAALTGESTPVDKQPHATLEPATALGDRRNMVYMGTSAAAGKAGAVVVATGMDTQIGQIAGMLQRHQPEPTPLQRRLAELGRTLLVVVLVAVAIIFTLHLLRGGNVLQVLLLSVSLAVAAVPEGLPAIVTIALALGLQRMAWRNALIRKLPSVETLGQVTVVCSDKTGTLTRNEMTVRQILAGQRLYHVTGTGYAPHGEFLDAAEQRVDPAAQPDLIRTLTVAAWCNHAQLTCDDENEQSWHIVGDPTEGALLVAAMKAGIQAPQREQRIIHELPFDSDRKAMSVVVAGDDGSAMMYTKGAPEVVLEKCLAEQHQGQAAPLTDQRRKEILDTNREMAAGALRVLALAYRQVPAPSDDYAEKGLVFAGLAGMIDPPRQEAKLAVHKARQAGIRPVMITGDHPDTALAIACELGIADPTDQVITGRQLDDIPDQELSDRVQHIPVYARVSAEHKLRVVRAWKARGQIVAMTGDGVNDAPAVQAADIGIAMGITGSDVTKDASDMVLTDDNFASIINAVEEGRGIFDNIQKFVYYLLSCNAGEVIFMFVAALLGWPAPLLAIQILWINLVTDALPALALGVEPTEPDIMLRPPRPTGQPVIGLRRGLAILYHGSLIAAATLLGFLIVYRGQEANLERARTAAFCIMAYAQLFFAFACRSPRRTLPELGLLSNRWLLAAVALSGLLQLAAVLVPFVQPMFNVATGMTWEWALILILALTPVTLMEVAKLISRAVSRRAWHPSSCGWDSE
jgi:Ca2+-transporting ATPase